MEAEKKERVSKGWRTLSGILFLTCSFCIIALVTVILLIRNEKGNSKIDVCYGVPFSGPIDLNDPEYPSVFHDLTRKEFDRILNYMYGIKDFSLSRPPDITIDSNYIFAVDLHVPNKNKALAYLDKQGSKPERKAKVIVFHGGDKNPVVKEYIVGPLPSPTQHTVDRIVPFHYRPPSIAEYNVATDMLKKKCHEVIRELLQESFDGSTLNCGKKCLDFYIFSPYASLIAGQSERARYRAVWYCMVQLVDYSFLHPVDFCVLVSTRLFNFSIDTVWYNGKHFSTLRSLRDDYNSGDINKLSVQFPKPAGPTLKDNLFPKLPQRPPIEVEPDGKRYTIKGQQVSYMNWMFDFRISNTQGPQLYDIRFKNERIVYEMSLQEIAVFYSGNSPSHMFSNYFDSYAMLGQQMKNLVPGTDCPLHATFIDSFIVGETSKNVVRNKNAICIFEHNTGEPLQRHHSRGFPGRFYQGTPNVVLIFRTVATIDNYDYIFDFTFFHNGAIETKVVSSGVIMPSFRMGTTVKTNKYGFKLNNQIVGNIHHHLFHFKVDIDVLGKLNRYSTYDIKVDKSENHFAKQTSDWYQEKIQQVLYQWENEAVLRYNFSEPKYHVFYSNDNSFKDVNGNHRSYRIVNRGMSKSVLPEGFGNELSASWMRYQMAVTQYKETERQSSSIYSSYDGRQPTVNFQDFINKENIRDQDLVAWVTLGAHHIPHTEDLPMTQGPGMDLKFFLLPFNFFPQDPSIDSRDTLRISYNPKTPEKGLLFNRSTKTESLSCIPPVFDYFAEMNMDPENSI